jgi:hypothetical protein
MELTAARIENPSADQSKTFAEDDHGRKRACRIPAASCSDSDENLEGDREPHEFDSVA